MRRGPSTQEDALIVRNWTLAVLLAYGAIALAAFGIVGLRHHLAVGSSATATNAAAAVTAVSAATGDQGNR
jgi:hypothetical protein